MENYVPVYPSIDDPDIQRIVSRKKEFNELTPRKDDVVTRDDYKLLNRQKLFARLTKLGDQILNIHGTGSGKTCGFIEALEQYKNSGTYDKAIIVERNENLIDVIKEQIINTCTKKGEYYTTEESSEGVTQRMKRKRENKSLDKWYIFKTYGAFTNELSDMSDELIKSKYSHKIIVFDEAHNINGGDKDSFIISEEDRKKIYPETFRLTHNIVQSKIILVSATPMINDVKEIAKLFNLFRPIDKQIKLKNTYSLQEVESFARGRVSYFMAGLPDVNINYMGTLIPFKDPVTGIDTEFRMYLSKLGDIQEKYYQSIDNKAFNSEENKASTMVFPIIDGQPTTDSDYIEEFNGVLKWKNSPLFYKWEERGNYLSFAEWLKNKNNLRRLSGKIAEIVDIETSSEGCSFIYSFNVNKSGTSILGSILSLYGFEQFKEKSSDSIFIQGDNTKIRDSFKKKKRVAIIAGDVSSKKQSDIILKLFNSPANVNGEYIKILIGSVKVRDGISVYHCQRMHLIQPHWNFAGMIQSINRVLRVVGHNDLRKQKIRQAEELGYLEGSKEYKEITKIDVNIYRHCIDYNLDENIRKLSDNNSDYKMMKTAVSKEIKINDIMDSLKICALDAHINRKANELSLEDPFNHRKIKFLPTWTELQDPNYVFLKTDPTDFSTYHIAYMDVEKLIDYMKTILRSQGSISYENIFDKFNNKYTIEEIYEAVSKLRNENRYLSKEYDQKMNIEIGPTGVYIQRLSTPWDPRFIHDISLYDSNPVVTYQNNPLSYLKKIKHDIMARKCEELIENISDINNDSKIYRDKIKYLLDLSVWEKIYVLEELYLSKHNISDKFAMLKTEEISSLSLLFKGYLYEIYDKDGDKYYVHILDSSERDNSHNSLTRHKEPKEITIFSPNEGFVGWRTPIEKEYQFFLEELKKIIEENLRKYEKNNNYGTILKDGIFRLIANVSNESVFEDKRLGQTGKEPKSYTKKEKVLISVIERIFPTKKSQEKKYSSSELKKIREFIREDVSKEYEESLDDEQVRIYSIWDACNNVDSYFQTEIIRKLKKDDRIYQPYILTENN